MSAKGVNYLDYTVRKTSNIVSESANEFLEMLAKRSVVQQPPKVKATKSASKATNSKANSVTKTSTTTTVTRNRQQTKDLLGPTTAGLTSTMESIGHSTVTFGASSDKKDYAQP